PGTSEQMLDTEKIYSGQFLSDIPSVMAVFGSVQDDLVMMLKDIRTTLSSLNSYLEDEKMESNIKNSLANLSDVSRKLNEMIDENRENVQSLTHNTVELTNDAKEFLDTNKQSMHESINKINKVLEQTEKLISKLNQVADETVQQQNNFGKLLYDENLMNNIQTSLEQLNKLSTMLVDQLQGKGIKVDANIF